MNQAGQGKKGGGPAGAHLGWPMMGSALPPQSSMMMRPPDMMGLGGAGFPGMDQIGGGGTVGGMPSGMEMLPMSQLPPQQQQRHMAAIMQQQQQQQMMMMMNGHGHHASMLTMPMAATGIYHRRQAATATATWRCHSTHRRTTTRCCSTTSMTTCSSTITPTPAR